MKTTLFKSLLAVVACLFASTAWAQDDEPTYTVPEPATVVEKELNVIGTTEVLVEQYVRSGYDADAFQFDFSEVVTKLGVPSAEEFAAILPDLLYSTKYFMGDESLPGGPKLDSLSNEYTANAPGFWMRAVLDDDEKETGECASAPYSADDKFYIEAFAFNAEENILSFNVGQYPGNLRGGQSYFANIYLIYGDKAWQLHIVFNVLKLETGTLADYNKVNESTITLEQVPTTGYETVVARPDMDVIAAELGCEVSEIRWMALDDAGEFANSTANYGGFWFNADGAVVGWGSSSVMFIEPAASGNFATLNVGQYPNALGAGDKASATTYFIGGENYYALTITLQVIEKPNVEVEFKSVAERGVTIQTLVSATTYPIEQSWTMPLDDLEALIGTTSPNLFGLATDANAEASGNIYSDAYSCDPKPGFWLNADGRVSVWGDSNARVGISYLSDGTFEFFQYPGRNSVGEVFKTQLFLVNVTTGNMVTFNINVCFVETLEEKEIVGSEEVLIPVGGDVEIPFDLSAAAEALGVSIEDLVNEENPYMRGLTSAGIYGDGQSAPTGLAFDADGAFNPYGDIYFTIEYDAIRNEVIMATVSNIDIPENFKVPAQFCFEIENKQYVFYAHLVSESIYVGIDGVKAEKKDNNIYDLSGRRVVKPVRGLYIKNAKKILIK